MIIDPWGCVIAQMGNDEGWAIADINLNKVLESRTRPPPYRIGGRMHIELLYSEVGKQCVWGITTHAHFFESYRFVNDQNYISGIV